MSKKKILITGGCGFIGSSLALDLSARGYEVEVFDNLSRFGSRFIHERLSRQGIRCVEGDVRLPKDLDALGSAFSLMILCSSEPSVLAGTSASGARAMLDVNLLGTINCLDWAQKRQVPVLFLSSSRVYPFDRLNACQYRETATRFELETGCPGVTQAGVGVGMPLQGVRSMYGASKLCAEFLIQEYAAQGNIPALINRCGVVAGPWQLGRADQGIFTFWLARHYFKQPLRYIGFGGQGKQVRDVLHVDDLAALVARQAACLIHDQGNYRGDVFNAGGSVGINASLRELTVGCEKITGNSLHIQGADEDRPADLIWYITDNGATEEEFDWKPRTSVETILEDTGAWIKDNESVCRKIFLEQP